MRKNFRGASFYLLLLVIIVFAVTVLTDKTDPVTEYSITEVIDHVENNQVEKIVSVGNTLKGELKNGTKFTAILSDLNKYTFYSDYLKDKVDGKEISFGAEDIPQPSWFVRAIPTILMLLVFGLFWFSFMQRSQGGGGNMMSFGKSKAKIHKDEGLDITFEDVASLREEKEELEEIVDFLKSPSKYTKIGARIPKGVLMIGQPGTGKTYLSKAVAGEAKVPFFSISGSDFVEMFVGVGASRVRDLFENAKKNAPCIIFIDEIDAVARRRGAGMGGGHDEREQTLNQLLVEMDGFGENEGVIVMAATNRPDILDPAILRPGRFDRKVYVDLPDVRGREEILEVHTKDKPLAEDVSLKVVAKRTPGFTPADLENLTNEAALLTARYSQEKISMETIDEASIKVVAGPEKKSKVISEKEKRLTAYHEAGHAITSRLLPTADPVHMVTIIPRGGAGGFTAYLPEEDTYYMTKKQMEEELVSLLGGRVAEALVLEDISTGAQNDIERATELAKKMVTHYGMSDKLGPMTYGTNEEEVFVGRDMGRTRDYSEKVAASIDTEMRSIIDEAYHKAEELLAKNMDILHRVAKTLIEKETLDGKEFEEIFIQA